MCSSLNTVGDAISDESSSVDADELMLGSKEWTLREKAVSLSAERDGYYDGRQGRLQSRFETGLKDGFQLVSQLALDRGRLSIRAARNFDSKDVLLHLIDHHKLLEDELVQSLLQLGDSSDPDALAKLVSKANDAIHNCLPTDVTSKIAQS
ncbi:unnamed protein product [Dicrocoelium dendriticum]|nr:unnamed protein product [Dicrocoelium dendriticum]